MADSLIVCRGAAPEGAACDKAAERVMGSDAARVVGRFKPDGPDGFCAATAPVAPLRATRSEAVEDERAWLDG